MNLLSSCLEGDLSKVKYFAVLFEIDSKDFYGNTGLALSVKKGHKQVAEYLLSKGASPNSKNHSLQRPLHHACLFGNSSCVDLLLKFKAEVNVQDQAGTTPLIIASRLNFFDIVEKLLQAGADPRLEDRFGKKAVNRAKNLEIITELQKTRNKKFVKKNRSKSAPFFGRLFATFDEKEWKKSKIGGKIMKEVEGKVGELANSLAARNEGFLKNEIFNQCEESQVYIKKSIENWSLAHWISFQNELDLLVLNVSKTQPARIDLNEVFKAAYLDAVEGIGKKIKARLVQVMRKKVKRKIQEMIMDVKNEVVGKNISELRKKFLKHFDF